MRTQSPITDEEARGVLDEIAISIQLHGRAVIFFEDFYADLQPLYFSRIPDTVGVDSLRACLLSAPSEGACILLTQDTTKLDLRMAGFEGKLSDAIIALIQSKEIRNLQLEKRK